MSLKRHINSQFGNGLSNLIIGLTAVSYGVLNQFSIANVDESLVRILAYLLFITVLPMLVLSRSIGQTTLLYLAKDKNLARCMVLLGVKILLVLCSLIAVLSILLREQYFVLTEIMSVRQSIDLYYALLGLGFAFSLNVFSKYIVITLNQAKRAIVIEVIFAAANAMLQWLVVPVLFLQEHQPVAFILSSAICLLGSAICLLYQPAITNSKVIKLSDFIKSSQSSFGSEFVFQLVIALAPFFYALSLQASLGPDLIALIAVTGSFTACWDRFFAAQSVPATVFLAKQESFDSEFNTRLRALAYIYVVSAFVTFCCSLPYFFYIQSKFKFVQFDGSFPIYLALIVVFIFESMALIYLPSLRALKKHKGFMCAELVFGPQTAALAIWIFRPSANNLSVLVICVVLPSVLKWLTLSRIFSLSKNPAQS